MTAEEVRARADAIRTCPASHLALLERRLLIDVLRAIANSNINRATTRALAEAALEVLRE